MSDVTNSVSYNADSEECISLYDIWQKLVQYKKIYWAIFFVTFIVGCSFVFMAPTKHEVSQVFKVGEYVDDKGERVQLIDSEVVAVRIKSVYVDRALRKYNSQTKSRINPLEYKISIKDAGGGVFVLSANSSFAKQPVYEFIFKDVITSIYEDIKDDVEFRKKNLSNLKENLEARLQEINSFYKHMLKKGFDYADASPKKSDIVALEGKIVSMYLNDQQTIAINLANSINSVQAQINGTFDVKNISDFNVSDFAVGPSKSVLLFLVVMAALFCAFIGVYIISSLRDLGNR